MNQQDHLISNAVKEVLQMKNRNKWPLRFCVGKIAEWHKIQYGVLLNAVLAIYNKNKEKPQRPDNFGNKASKKDRWWTNY